ncbi:MAG: ComEC/Rec2 family competence protein [Spirochaetota bacterium]
MLRSPYPVTLPVIVSLSFLPGVVLSLILASPFVLIPSLMLAVLAAISAVLVRHPIARIALIGAAFFASGAGYTTARYYDEFRSPVVSHAKNTDGFEAVIMQYEGLNVLRHSHLARVTRVFATNASIDAFGTIRLYSNAEEPFIAGDRILVRRPILLYRDLLADSDRMILDILEKRRIYGVSSIYRRSDYLHLEHASPIAAFAQRAAFGARSFIKRSLGTYTSGATYAITQCFILGDKSPISKDIMTDFQRSGTMHILSVSGLHFSMVIAIIVLLAGFIPMNSFARITLAVVVTVLVYSPMTLYVPPVMRSAVMALLLVPVMLFDRTRNLPNVLFLTLFVLLVISPKDIGDISFLLSFVATCSLVLIIPPLDAILRERLRVMRHPALRYVSGAVLTSVAAVIFTAPFTMHFFGTVNFTSIISNMIAVPLSFIMLSLSFLVVATAAIPVIPVWYAAALTAVTKLFIAVNTFFAGVPLRIDGISLPFAAAAVLSLLFVAIGILLSIWLHRIAENCADAEIV